MGSGTQEMPVVGAPGRARVEDVQGAVTKGMIDGLFQGRVLDAKEDGILAVAAGEDTLTAKRSLSCLLEPAVGDKVLLARVDHETFVLAVLDRLLPDAMTLSVRGAKRLVLSAPAIEVSAEDRLALRGRETTMQGERVHLLAKSFNLVGQMVAFVSDVLRSTAGRNEVVADQIMTRAGDRATFVSGADVSEIGTLVQNVEQVSTHTAQTSIMTAEEDLRFDGKRVTVG